MMKTYTIIFWFCMLKICSYCNTDFSSVKRHEWGCKKKPNAHSTKSSCSLNVHPKTISIIENQMRTIMLIVLSVVVLIVLSVVVVL